MRLFNSAIPNQRHVSHNGTIKITSPEQFVPIWLASFIPDGATQEWWYSDNDRVVVPKELYNELVDSPERERVSLLRKGLAELLNSDVPKEYTLSNDGFQNSGVGYTYFNDYFVGNYRDLYPFSQDTNYLVGLGMVVRTYSNLASTTLKSQLYSEITQSYSKIYNWEAKLVVLVKAKHLKYIRAKLYFNQPYSLPHGDIMIMKTAGNDTNISTIYARGLKDFVAKEDIQTKFVSQEEINSYLFKTPSVKTAQQTIEDAKEVFRNREKYAFVQ